MLGFFCQQLFAVLSRDLVIVGVDFGKGQKSVAISAIVDKSGLQRRFDAGYFCEIDIAFELFVFGRFKIEFLNLVSLYDRHPGFFLVARVD